MSLVTVPYLISDTEKNSLNSICSCSYGFTRQEQHATESARRCYLAEMVGTNTSVQFQTPPTGSVSLLVGGRLLTDGGRHNRRIE